MSQHKSEIDDILAKRDDALASIVSKSNELYAASDAIVNAARRAARAYTKAEKAQLKDIGMGLVTTDRAERDVRLVVIERLNNSAGINNLISTVDSTNKDLKSVFNDMKAVSNTIKSIGDAIGKITALIGALQSLLTVV
jgi:hypothetical protein